MQVEVVWACPWGGGHAEAPLDKQEQLARERKVQGSLPRLLPPQPSHGYMEENGWVGGIFVYVTLTGFVGNSVIM